MMERYWPEDLMDSWWQTRKKGAGRYATQGVTSESLRCQLAEFVGPLIVGLRALRSCDIRSQNDNRGAEKQSRCLYKLHLQSARDGASG